MRRTFSIWFAFSACLAFAPGLLRAQAAPSVPKFTVLISGTGAADLVEVEPGRFFGLDGYLGIFSITSAGNFQNFYDFPIVNGISTFGLTPALNGQLYGSASNSGITTVFSELFSVAPDDNVTTYSYNPATQPLPFDEIQSPYGLYAFLGTLSGLSFGRLNYDGNSTPLYTFPTGMGYIGGVPFLGLDGAFYGLMLTNNTANAGIFRLTASGAFSWVVPSFPTGGVNYQTSLIQATNGNFYGVLPAGGNAGAGSIYEVTSAGQMTTIYQFPNINFGIPETLLEASDGMLYGTAQGRYSRESDGSSSIFQLNPTTGQVKTVYTFPNDGLNGSCECTLIQGSDGTFYGTAIAGAYDGAIFSLDLGLPRPKPHIGVIEPTSQAPGAWVLIWGSNLLGTTGVNFNGTLAAGFAIASSQGVYAQVPAGATSGPITILTPHGTSTSQQYFTVQ